MAQFHEVIVRLVFELAFVRQASRLDVTAATLQEDRHTVGVGFGNDISGIAGEIRVDFQPKSQLPSCP